MNSVSMSQIAQVGFGPGVQMRESAEWLLRQLDGLPFTVEGAGWMVEGAGAEWRFVIALGDAPDCTPMAAYAAIIDLATRTGWPADLRMRDLVVTDKLFPRRGDWVRRGAGFAAE